MGDRGQVAVESDQGTVYLYTHWGATNLPERVAEALGREARWRDASYLTRIVFCEMVRGDLNGTKGFGIQPHSQPDARLTVTLDVESQEASLGETYDHDGWRGSFEDFVDRFGE